MGAVYLAQDMQNRRTVAIKVARLPGPEARAQFQREADYLQKLHHHSLPRVWDYFSDTQRDFLVMEYIPGEDLETLVHRKGPQPEWLVLRWTDELLDGLEYLHSQNPPIIHRDVKPGNLKLRQDETLVLVDFGIAKEFLPGTDTSPGANAVTPGFSPLEQYSDIVTDARTDIYSVGATMYFLLTGHIPPPAPDRASGDKKLLPPSQLVPDTTAGTEMVARKALSLPRDERWANASEMRSALAQASQQRAARETPPKTSSFKIPGAPPPGKTPTSAPEGTGKRPAGCIALVALAAVALLAVGALVWSSGILKPGGATAEPSTQITVQATAAPAVAQRATFTPTPPPATATPTVAQLTTKPTATLEPTSTPASTTGAGNGAEIPTSTPIPTRTPTPAARTATPTSTRGQENHRSDARAHGNVSGWRNNHIAYRCPDGARRRRSRRRRSRLSLAGRQPPAGQPGFRACFLEAGPGRYERWLWVGRDDPRQPGAGQPRRPGRCLGAARAWRLPVGRAAGRAVTVSAHWVDKQFVGVSLRAILAPGTRITFGASRTTPVPPF